MLEKLFSSYNYQNCNDLQLVHENLLAPEKSSSLLLVNTGVDFAKILFQNGYQISTWEDSYANFLHHQALKIPSYHGENENTTATVAILKADKSTSATFYWLQRISQIPTISEIWLCGENTQGIRGLQKKVEREWGESTTIASAKKSRLFRVVPQPLFKLPHHLPLHYSTSTQVLEIFSAPGTFGYGKHDKGSELLINNLPDLSSKKVLDLGCGNGILCKAAYLNGATDIYATDFSSLALKNTTANFEQTLKIEASVLGNIYPDQNFDYIITNPPFHIARSRNLNIPQLWVQESHRLLRNNGKLLLVANRFLPYREILSQFFKTSAVLSENTDFVVYSADK